MSKLSQQRRADAENKAVVPTLPLPLLNKPNIKEVKSPSENQIINDSKTQDIAQKMFPTNKLSVTKTESSNVFKCIIVKVESV